MLKKRDKQLNERKRGGEKKKLDSLEERLEKKIAKQIRNRKREKERKK